MAQNTRKSTKKENDIFETAAPKKKNKDIAQWAQKMELLFEKNQKAIIGTIAAIVIAVGGFFGYKYFIQMPKEEKAATALSYAQQWFDVDSFNMVLNGDGLNSGALSVIQKFSGTKAANLAQFYAGVSYLNTNNPQKAIEYLSKFNGHSTPVEFAAYGALGDAYMDAGNNAEGIKYYKKAASDKTNNFIAPLYLFRAGLACEVEGKKDEALKLYEEVKKEFPSSAQAQDIDKYMARLGEVSID